MGVSILVPIILVQRSPLEQKVGRPPVLMALGCTFLNCKMNSTRINKVETTIITCQGNTVDVTVNHNNDQIKGINT